MSGRRTRRGASRNPPRTVAARPIAAYSRSSNHIVEPPVDSYWNAPLYKDLGLDKDTYELAEPQDPEHVSGVTVVEVRSEGACYRGSYVHGLYAVADPDLTELPKDGEAGVPVYCRWFGGREDEGPAVFQIDPAKARLIRNYTGYVVTNLAEFRMKPSARRRID